MNVVESTKGNEDSNLFMAHGEEVGNEDRAWLIDSGCFNHMTGRRELLRELDETKRQKVKLGDDKEMQMSGEGTVAITTSKGQIKLLHKVHYVPNLAYNLLSVGQLILSGYNVLFTNQACYIRDAETEQLMIKVQMTANKMFPLDIAQMENYGLVSKELSTSVLWHLKYGHLSGKGLKLLHKKEMVLGLPQPDELEV